MSKPFASSASNSWTISTLCGLAALLCFAGHPNAALAQDEVENFLGTIDWQFPPSKGRLGNVAEVTIPEGCIFATAADTKRLLEMMENPTSGLELGFLAQEDLSWFVVFEYEAIGYVKDDEKDSLDADAMLRSFRAGTEEANKERRRRGWSTMTILGWEQPPHYDSETNNLVWAIRGESEGHVVVNYNTRRLGREGVMSVALVLEPSQLSSVVPTFNSLMEGYTFMPGKTYAEFRSGDKIAEYGLTALVTGGAVAVAAKSGLFKWLWKGIVVVALGIGAAVKGLFGRRATNTS